MLPQQEKPTHETCVLQLKGKPHSPQGGENLRTTTQTQNSQRFSFKWWMHLCEFDQTKGIKNAERMTYTFKSSVYCQVLGDLNQSQILSLLWSKSEQWLLQFGSWVNKL